MKNDLELNALVMEAQALALELGRLQRDGENIQMFNVCSAIHKNAVAMQMRLNHLNYQQKVSL